jgi:transcriptional regulator with PAS, ATPase and Fis domain
VIQKDPRNANAIHNLGVLYLRQGMRGDMESDLKEFLQAEDAEQILLGLTRSMVEAARQSGGEDGARMGILGRSRAIQEVLDLARRAAGTESTVLLLGDNGTGKELLARAIHQMSPRKDKAFVAVNCGALPESLLESELFGHEKGAFTGAVAARAGRFELAQGGTLFLDEIGDLALPLQVKLLRAIQERTFERLGGTRTIQADFRLIAATHQDLRGKVARGEFREDLFYRLFVIPISLPALRERREDIPVLAAHFLRCFSERAGKRFQKISPGALERLAGHHWPGNVRELENLIERAVAIHDGVELKSEQLHFDAPDVAVAAAGGKMAPMDSLESAERQAILAQLKRSGFKVEVAARALGVSRATLYRKIQRYKIQDSEEVSQF